MSSTSLSGDLKRASEDQSQYLLGIKREWMLQQVGEAITPGFILLGSGMGKLGTNCQLNATLELGHRPQEKYW